MPASPAIVRIETVRWAEQPNAVWVRVHDEAGVHGLGETYYNAGAVESIVHDMVSPLVLGRPASIERTWHELFACANFYGHAGAELRAFSALDIALWDLLGRRTGLPAAELFGGRVRDRIPIYNTCVSAGRWDDGDAFLSRPGELAADLLGAGITMMKVWPWDRFAPQIDSAAITGPAGWSAMGPAGHRLPEAQLQEGLDVVREIVRATDGEMAIAIEGHSRWDLPTAVRICRALEPYGVRWAEDMIQPTSATDLARLADATTVPQAVSERLFTRHAYRPVFEHGAAGVAMVDVAWTGGLTEARKIATLADTYHLPLAPHDCTGPVSLAASLQLCGHAANALVMETVRGFCDGWYREVLDLPFEPHDGELAIPDGPGLGAALRDSFLARDDVVVTVSDI